ncbi:trigger factor [Mycoplasmopsis adleri]|uniref:trigger factor n=1 Tax=Mycoplasmopsis adleri TaxID=51362 RepID=UPI003872FCE5
MVIKSKELNKDKTSVVVEVEFSGEDWKKVYDTVKAKKIKELKIPGFRPGKAPQHEIDKRITPVVVAYDAIEDMYQQDAQKIFDEVHKKYPSVVAMPALVDLPVLSEETSVVKVEFPFLPDLSKLDLSKIKVAYDKVSVSKKDIEKAIRRSFENEALLLPLGKDDKTEEGDVLIINYKGYVNNEPFDGGEAENFEIKLGSKTFIDNFEDQLIGKKIGWKGEVKVTFPKQYPVDSLKGQQATFDCEIVDAKRLEKIEITDEKIKSLNMPSGATTVKELEKEFKDNMTIAEVVAADRDAIYFLADAAVVENKIQIAPIIVRQQVEEKLSQIKAQLKSQNIKLEDYLQLLQKTEQQFTEALYEETKLETIKQLVMSHIMQENEKDFKEPTEADKLYAYCLIATRANMPLDMIVTIFGGEATKDNEQFSKMIAESAKEAHALRKLADSLNAENSKHNHDEVEKIVKATIKAAKEKEEKGKAEEAKKEEKPKKTTTKAKTTTKKSTTKSEETKK